MKENHSCLIHRYDPRDWHLGDGRMPEKMMGASINDWTPYFHFMERQRIDFETGCCVIFSAQEIVDAEMDYLISVGRIPDATLQLFNQLGFMDTNSDDQKAHFHSSARFWSILTGNGQNGNALQDPWNVARKYGCIPWTDLPFDETITTPEEYFAPIPQALLDKGQQFLAAVGGKNWIQFHWVYENFNAVYPSASVDATRYQTPLHIGVNVGTNWNVVEPPVPPVGSPAGHSISNIANSTDGESCLDHYNPFIKTLVNGYPIPEIMQAVVTINPPPPAPTLPINATPLEKMGWLNQLKIWLFNLWESITPTGRARLQGASRSPKWSEVRNAFIKGKSCAVCGTKKNLEAHHIKVFHLNPADELNPENLIALCRTHHFEWGHFFNWASWDADVVAKTAEMRKEVQNRP